MTSLLLIRIIKFNKFNLHNAKKIYFINSVHNFLTKWLTHENTFLPNLVNQLCINFFNKEIKIWNYENNYLLNLGLILKFRCSSYTSKSDLLFLQCYDFALQKSSKIGATATSPAKIGQFSTPDPSRYSISISQNPKKDQNMIRLCWENEEQEERKKRLIYPIYSSVGNNEKFMEIWHEIDPSKTWSKFTSIKFN